MPAEVMIETGDRSAISYLVKPLADQINRANLIGYRAVNGQRAKGPTNKVRAREPTKAMWRFMISAYRVISPPIFRKMCDHHFVEGEFVCRQIAPHLL